MPPIASRLRPAPLESATTFTPQPLPQRPPIAGASPLHSTTLRCPMPPLSTVSPDNLRQYYVGGAVPQFRFNPPSKLS